MTRGTHSEGKKMMNGNGAMHNQKISCYMYDHINMYTEFAVHNQH